MAYRCSSINTFNSDDTGHMLNRANYLVEVFFVVDLDRHLDHADVVLRNVCTGVADTCLYVGDGIGNAGEHAGAVLGGCKELYGLDLFFITLGPLDVDYSLF